MTTLDFSQFDIPCEAANQTAETVAELSRNNKPVHIWQQLTEASCFQHLPFEAQVYLHGQIFDQWDSQQGPVPMWVPNPNHIESSNIGQLMRRQQCRDYHELHLWSVTDRDAFWKTTIEQLGIKFDQQPSQTLAVVDDAYNPRWLAGGRLNIVESCWGGDNRRPAIISGDATGKIKQWSVSQLREMTNRVSNGLIANGFAPGDAIAIYMPMTPESVAIYLGIIQAGCVVIGIADSFSPPEIQIRVQTTNAKAIFTVGRVIRNGKVLALYDAVIQADAPRAIVLKGSPDDSFTLRHHNDSSWDDFISDNTSFDAHIASPDSFINVLFSSGTTGTPKAIPLDHTTAIKFASDGYYHQDIKPGDVVAWPTSLGWIMGPWLILASLISQATMALFQDAPTIRAFGQFVENARVNMLGTVPSIVRKWRETRCMKELDWSAIKLFSSTGECSNAQDMFYLSHLANFKPIIEYCGGTEIGGGYVSSTVVQPNAPSVFSGPILGIDFHILDENDVPADMGEAFLVPPSMGLSTQLCNGDHDEVYYAHVPKGPDGQLMRRHGDYMQVLPGSYYRVLGRVDDTMNIGGVKVSSAEIEHCLNNIESVKEVAAIAANSPGGGPTFLVIYVVIPNNVHRYDSDTLRAMMQRTIRNKLNPLFKIHDVVLVNQLPRTASQKIMRRELRSQYHDQLNVRCVAPRPADSTPEADQRMPTLSDSPET